VQIKTFGLSLIAIVLLSANLGALAQNAMQDRFDRFGGAIDFKGQIDAYSPQTATTGTAGPYEIHGPWSLKIIRERGSDKIAFSAALNMELSDGWVLTTNRNSSAPFDPSARNAHTHHITMTEGQITVLPTGGFQISGTGTVTLNGGPTPFAQQSPLTLTITGGPDVEFSNATMTFGAPASGHFGTVPLSGVVRSIQEQR
jgi:hypothetical protein